MKDKYNSDSTTSRGIIIGLAASSCIGLYDIYHEDINREVMEIYKKLQPYINTIVETTNKIDPDLAQIGISSTAVAVLTGILIHLRKKELEENKKEFKNVTTGFMARDLTKEKCYTTCNKARTLNLAYKDATARHL